MSRLTPARRIALDTLITADEHDAYVRDVLDRALARTALDRREAAFALRLVLGVSATRGCLDELVDRFVAKPASLDLPVRMALRIATFEIVYFDTPVEAAVSQGVELVRSRARSAAGLANAVLHRVAEAADAYLDATDIAGARHDAVRAARRAGLPVWLVRQVAQDRGRAAAEGLCACELAPAPLAVHMNSRVGLDLVRDGGGVALGLPGAVRVDDVARLRHAGAFERAELVVSDLHAQLVATAATRPGATLEVGAGRGTKTFVMAAQAARAGLARTHVAVDLSPRKVEANRARLARAGLAGGVSFGSGDCCDLDTVLAEHDRAAGAPVRFDTVLVDAPCSGTGTMRRHPEIPWRLKADDLTAIAAVQLRLLAAAAAHVAAGGMLLYATCSVMRCENEGVVERFLASEEGSAFQVQPLSGVGLISAHGYEQARRAVHAAEDASGMFQTLPATDAFDGHFCVCLRRRV